MSGQNQDSARVTVLRARQLLRDRRFADALQVCTDELARGADLTDLRLVAAHSLFAQGRYEGAKKEAHQVLRLDPGTAEAHRLLTDVCCARGDVDGAGFHLGRILSLVPDDEDAARVREALQRSSERSGLASMRATSVGRFIDRAEEREVGTPVEDSVIDGLSGGDIESQGEQMAKDRDDSAISWLPEGKQKHEEPPSELAALEALAGQNEDDAPTIPLFRASKPKEPELRLDPRADEPVSEEQRDDLLPGEESPSTQPISAGQIVSESLGPSESDMAKRDIFEDFRGAPDDDDEADLVEDIEPASAPDAQLVVEERKREVRKPRKRSPSEARGQHDTRALAAERAAADEPSGQQRRTTGPRTEVLDEPEQPGDLMSMLAGGDVPHDDSLPSMPAMSDPQPRPKKAPAPARKKKPSRPAPPAAEESWDPLSAMEAATDTDDSLSDFGLQAEAAASSEVPLGEPLMGKSTSKGGGRWVVVLLVLILLAGGGGYGYYRYHVHKVVTAHWVTVAKEVRRGTLAGYQEAQKQLALIAEKRPASEKVAAARAMCAAALSIEFGEDRRKEAKKALEQAKGDSRWRTAARGFLGLIEDPSTAAGYLQKGVEIFPDASMLSYLRGRALDRVGKMQPAVDAYEKALKQSPDFLAAQVARAALVGRYAKGYEKAAELLDKVLKVDAKHVAALVARARLRAGHNRDLSAADADLLRVTGELAKYAGKGQLGWAELVKAQIARRRNLLLVTQLRKAGKGREMVAQSIIELNRALDAAIKSTSCCDAQFRYDVAGELMDLFRYREALQQLEAAVALAGRWPKLRLRTARVLLELGRSAAAHTHLALAPTARPETKLLMARYQLASGKLAQAAASLATVRDPRWLNEAQSYLALAEARQGKSAEAIRRLREVLKRDPHADIAARMIGEVHWRVRDLAKAEKSLKRAFRINSLDPRIAARLGQIAMARQQLKKAARRYAYALKVRPGFPPAHIGLAETLLVSGAVSQARAELGKVALRDRELPRYHVVDARVALAEGKPAAAAAAVARAQQSGARGSSLARAQGELALAAGKAKEALPLLLKAKKASPKDTELLLLLGRAQLAARRGDDAYNSFHDVLKYDDDNPEALLELGKIAIKDAEWPLAVKNLKDCVAGAKKRQFSPAFLAQAHTALGKAFLKKGDTGRALTNLQDALELDSGAAGAHFLMGQTYDRLDRPKRAVGHYTKALALKPSWAKVQLRLGRAQAKAGDAAAAVANLKAYLSKKSNDRNLREIKRLIRKLERSSK